MSGWEEQSKGGEWVGAADVIENSFFDDTFMRKGYKS